MVKIRLMRVGKRKQPSYRVVVADARSPRDGRIIETIGKYAPRQEPSLVDIDGERALYWLRQGAQPSDQVRQLLRITGAWSEFTGEPAPAGIAGSATPAAASTQAAPARPAAGVKVTPAASTEEEPSSEVVEAAPGAADKTAEGEDSQG